MSTIASTALTNRNSLIRLSVIGGLITGILHLIVQVGIVFGLLLKSPYISSLQFVASGAMGNAAYTGGLATALLGLVLELLMTIIIAGIFVVGADRIPLLRRYVIPGSLLYGFGVFIVMNFIILPLSAAAASSTHVAVDRDHSGTHPAHRAAVGNTCTAEYAVNPKITDESKATRLAKVLGSIQFESVAEGKQLTSQCALAMTWHGFGG